MNFLGKKILLISPCFFDYEKAMKNRLQELGAEVDFYDERPANNIFTKGMIRLQLSIYQEFINRYYRGIISEIKDKKYDYFLLIKGESIPFFFLEEFAKQHKNTKRIYNAYDSVCEYPKTLQLIPYFDKNFTFEPDDAKKYGMCFRSNFYLENYASTSPSAKKKYDLVFIGSVHTDRWQVGEKVEKQVNQLGFHSLFHYYAPSRWVMLMRKFLDKNLKGFNLKKITSKKLSHQETAELYAQSKAILDINKPFQKGLSMRIFDALAMKCKVITTNEEIKNYPFYNPKNILIIDRENPKIDKSFLETDFEEIPKEILQKMSLDAWLSEIFS